VSSLSDTFDDAAEGAKEEEGRRGDWASRCFVQERYIDYLFQKVLRLLNLMAEVSNAQLRRVINIEMDRVVRRYNTACLRAEGVIEE
jgi:hypothetical protein